MLILIAEAGKVHQNSVLAFRSVWPHRNDGNLISQCVLFKFNLKKRAKIGRTEQRYDALSLIGGGSPAADLGDMAIVVAANAFPTGSADCHCRPVSEKC